MKYVIFDYCGQEAIILADDIMPHVDMVKTIPHTLLLSAGFCTLNPPKCFGESTSLNLKSRPGDTLTLMRYTRKSNHL
jgi:hypothetical protein